MSINLHKYAKYKAKYISLKNNTNIANNTNLIGGAKFNDNAIVRVKNSPTSSKNFNKIGIISGTPDNYIYNVSFPGIGYYKISEQDLNLVSFEELQDICEYYNTTIHHLPSTSKENQPIHDIYTKPLVENQPIHDIYTKPLVENVIDHKGNQILDTDMFVGMRVWVVPDGTNNKNIPSYGIGGYVNRHTKNSGSDSGYTTEINLDNGTNAVNSLFHKANFIVYEYKY
jgi:hypothetical protein